jgi:hypothetical protein
VALVEDLLQVLRADLCHRPFSDQAEVPGLRSLWTRDLLTALDIVQMEAPRSQSRGIEPAPGAAVPRRTSSRESRIPERYQQGEGISDAVRTSSSDGGVSQPSAGAADSQQTEDASQEDQPGAVAALPDTGPSTTARETTPPPPMPQTAISGPGLHAADEPVARSA